ncbi:hypothetical protein DYD21_07555 [Rhodohalobacter sp. SW132]|uniref:BsuPI-related putative proteinase inhibitor n=1 Tax=Rhodohalobacter sp. SW132 TaxID=2293433 RepID=UPI000E22F2CA|nr:BsuPI-related putative proteinase inhibitor [Rhodohalobacter sp. SW132]REL37631.1 hypothetical protein DYD21_07555 [Rhodohalobacter sp. SW132]
MFNELERTFEAKIYWLILAGGLFFMAGCDAITNPFGSSGNSSGDWLLGSGYLPYGIELTLDLPEKVEKGESVPLKLTIRNSTKNDIELRYREYRRNFGIEDGDSGELVWSSEMINPVLLMYKTPLITLEAGEEITYEEEWNQTFGEYRDKYEPGSQQHRRNDDQVGKQVQAGTYRVYGLLYFGIKGAGNEQDFHTRPHTITIVE